MSDGGLRQEDGKFETSLGYITTSCQNKKKEERKGEWIKQGKKRSQDGEKERGRDGGREGALENMY